MGAQESFRDSVMYGKESIGINNKKSKEKVQNEGSKVNDGRERKLWAGMMPGEHFLVRGEEEESWILRVKKRGVGIVEGGVRSKICHELFIYGMQNMIS